MSGINSKLSNYPDIYLTFPDWKSFSDVMLYQIICNELVKRSFSHSADYIVDIHLLLYYVLRETSPHAFQLELFFNNATKPNSPTFHRLGRSVFL